MAAQTFKRSKVVKAIQRYKNMMEQAQKDAEDYAMREGTAADEKSKQYFKEMKEQNHNRFVSYRFVVNDMKYEFGITDEELKDENS